MDNAGNADESPIHPVSPTPEAILRGVKPIEFRSRPTNVRGRIYIYAALGRYSPEEEAEE